MAETKLSNNLRVVALLNNKTRFLNIGRGLVNTIPSESLMYEKYTVKEKAYWENISYEVYQNVEFGGILALINDIQNPFEQLYTGQELMIVKKQFIPYILEGLEVSVNG